MYQVLYVVAATVRVVVYALQLLMRAILSWMPMDEDNAVENFLYSVTEPVIMPVRSVIEHFGWFEGLPIDMSFFITFILLSIIGMFL